MQDLNSGNLTRKSVRMSGFFSVSQLPVLTSINEDITKPVIRNLNTNTSSTSKSIDKPDFKLTNNDINNKSSVLKKTPLKIQPTISEPPEEPFFKTVQLRKTNSKF